MRATRIKRLAVPLLSLSASLVFSACSCSVSIGGDDISADDIESEAAARLQKEVGAPEPPEIDCPNGLEAKAGESVTCTLTDPADGREYEMTATIKSVSGDDADFDFAVSGQPKG